MARVWRGVRRGRGRTGGVGVRDGLLVHPSEPGPGRRRADGLRRPRQRRRGGDVGRERRRRPHWLGGGRRGRAGRLGHRGRGLGRDRGRHGAPPGRRGCVGRHLRRRGSVPGGGTHARDGGSRGARGGRGKLLSLPLDPDAPRPVLDAEDLHRVTRAGVRPRRGFRGAGRRAGPRGVRGAGLREQVADERCVRASLDAPRALDGVREGLQEGPVLHELAGAPEGVQGEHVEDGPRVHEQQRRPAVLEQPVLQHEARHAATLQGVGPGRHARAEAGGQERTRRSRALPGHAGGGGVAPWCGRPPGRGA